MFLRNSPANRSHKILDLSIYTCSDSRGIAQDGVRILCVDRAVCIGFSKVLCSLFSPCVLIYEHFRCFTDTKCRRILKHKCCVLGVDVGVTVDIAEGPL